MVTSREAPPELAILGSGAVRRLQLGGLGVAEGQVLLADKQLSGNDEDWLDLIARFGGNGLALKMVGESIRQVFDGDIGAFLDQAGSSSIFGGIRRLLAEQIERSSALEQKLLRLLAVEREPLTLTELMADLGPRVRRGAVLEAVEALRRRSLVERAETAGAAAFTLQSVVLEYVTDRLVEDIGHEIARGQPLLLIEQPLIKAQAKDYVRQSQERLIGEPILQRLTADYGKDGAEQRLLALLEGWRDRPARGAGLWAWQRGQPAAAAARRPARAGPLAAGDSAGVPGGVEAQDASLAGAHLADVVLAEAFDFPGSVALSGDGALLAAGTSTGQVWLWRVADRTLVAMLEGHTGVVWGVALSTDGRPLVSGGGDGTVRLWDALSGRLLATLEGHAGQVWGVALSADGHLLASGGEDGTNGWWPAEVGMGQCDCGTCRVVNRGPTLQGHTGGVWSVALSADGQRLASGGQDGTVRLWEAPEWAAAGDPAGPHQRVWGVALSADGRTGGQRGWGWDGAAVGGQHRAPAGDAAGPHWRGLGRGALGRWAAAGQRRWGWDGAAVGAEYRTAPGDLAGPHQRGPGRGALGRWPTAGQRR